MAEKPSIARPFTLGKKERLKSRKLTGMVFETGKVLSFPPIRVHYLPTTGEPPLQAGFTAGRRQLRRAVDRNRAKRLMREAYRTRKQFLEEKLRGAQKGVALYLVYTTAELQPYEKVKDKIRQALEKLEKILLA